MIAHLLFALQASASAPDIQLGAHVRARSITIEKKGDAKLTVTTSPDGGNVVNVRAPKANGRKTLRNVEVDVRAEARIGQPVFGQGGADIPERPNSAETTLSEPR